jgi:hypothetical protein
VTTATSTPGHQVPWADQGPEADGLARGVGVASSGADGWAPDRSVVVARGGPPPGEPGRPLLAVCGLADGVGTSTLAFLVARAGAGVGRAPILLCAVDAAAHGLTLIAGASSQRSLGQFAAGVSGEGLPFVALDGRLRLIASTPRAAIVASDYELTAALQASRDAHGLTVVDCGTLGTPDSHVVLDSASHIVWVAPARAGAADLTRGILVESDVAPAPGEACELLAVVATEPSAARAEAALRDIAAERCRRLVLVPHHDRAPASVDLRNGHPLARAVDAIVELVPVPPVRSVGAPLHPIG